MESHAPRTLRRSGCWSPRARLVRSTSRCGCCCARATPARCGRRRLASTRLPSRRPGATALNTRACRLSSRLTSMCCLLPRPSSATRTTRPASTSTARPSRGWSHASAARWSSMSPTTRSWRTRGTPTTSYARALPVLVVHSMTKLHATPGLRLGYVVGAPEVIARLARQQQSWAVGAAELAAGLAMLAVDTPQRRARAEVTRVRGMIVEALHGRRPRGRARPRELSPGARG